MSLHIFRNGESLYQERPQLVETGIKTYMFHILSKCHDYKRVYYDYIFNLGSFLVFVVVMALFLAIQASSKMTKEEKEKQHFATQTYLLNKFKIFQQAKLLESQQLLTHLPVY